MVPLKASHRISDSKKLRYTTAHQSNSTLTCVLQITHIQ